MSIYVLGDNRRVLTADREQVINLWQAEDGVTYLTLHGPTCLMDLAPNREIALSGDQGESRSHSLSLSLSLSVCLCVCVCDRSQQK